MLSPRNFKKIQARSLWIGELDLWMDEGFLIKLFPDSAAIKGIKIIRDKTKSSNSNYGFIEFETPEKAKEFLEEFNGHLIPQTNKTLKLNWACYSAGKQAAMNINQATEYTIYVGDLDVTVTEEILTEMFSKHYSSVLGSKVIIDPINKTSKGYGFIKFSEQREAEKALIEMNGWILKGRPIKTNLASFKRMNSETNMSVNYNSPMFSGSINDQFSYGINTNLFSMSPLMGSINTYDKDISSQPVINPINYPTNYSEFLNNEPDPVQKSKDNSLDNLNNFYISNPNPDSNSHFNLSNFYLNNLHNNPYYTIPGQYTNINNNKQNFKTFNKTHEHTNPNS